jgi:5-methylcytosine-specific restriction enzyme subunit McrC
VTKRIDVRLVEWESVQPDETASGSALKGVWLDEPARRVATALSRSKVLDVQELRTGLAIRATSYVGRVELGPIRVTVEPKIARDALLSLFRYAFGLRRLTLVGTSTADAGALFQDVLLEQLRAELDELRRRGLLQRYVSRTELLGSPRGRIDCERLAARGGIVDETIPCRHAPRSLDHILNRTVVAGVALGARMAQSPSLRRELLALGRKLEPSVGVVHLDWHLLERAQGALSRLSSSYEPALKLLELLLSGTSIDLGEGDALTIPGFLFDMNRFFQALVERLLVDHLAGYETRSEVGLAGMMAYVKNPRKRRAPQPRPDIRITETRTGAVSLLDAKYRDLWNKPLPREMLYQLALYAISQRGVKSAAMIFPTVEASASEAIVEVRHPIGGGRIATVHLRPLHVEAVARAIDKADGSTLAQIAERLAKDVAA